MFSLLVFFIFFLSTKDSRGSYRTRVLFLAASLHVLGRGRLAGCLFVGEYQWNVLDFEVVESAHPSGTYLQDTEDPLASLLRPYVAHF